MPAVTDGGDEELRHEPGVDRVLEKGLHLPVGPGACPVLSYHILSYSVVLLVLLELLVVSQLVRGSSKDVVLCVA